MPALKDMPLECTVRRSFGNVLGARVAPGPSTAGPKRPVEARLSREARCLTLASISSKICVYVYGVPWAPRPNSQRLDIVSFCFVPPLLGAELALLQEVF